MWEGEHDKLNVYPMTQKTANISRKILKVENK